VGYSKDLLELTCKAFDIYSLVFLFSGFAIFASGFFTALNDGLTSAIISFLRTFLFQVAAVLILPLLLGLEGIWCAVIVAELMATAVTVVFLVVKRKKYGY
jgi:Na+-driven multidrug efflux pump